MLSIVTPIDLGRRPRELVERVNTLASESESGGLRLIIGHGDRGGRYDSILKEGMKKYHHVTVVSEKVSSASPNMARLRNIAANAVGSEVIVFFDADIFPDTNLIRTIARQTLSGASLAMAPCLYLSRVGTRRFSSHDCARDVVERAIDFDSGLILHWAMPSSVMAVRSDDYRELGGFYEGYEGHGYEDIDFILRLALVKGLVTPSSSLLIDRPYRAPLLAEGFRGVLSTLCLSNLLDGNIAFHLFHAKDGDESYYQSRNENAALFQRRIGALVAGLRQDEDACPPIIQAFFSECKRRCIDPARFHALFDARPRYMLQRKALHIRLRRTFIKYWNRVAGRYPVAIKKKNAQSYLKHFIQ
ncbi:galactosyltransferase-related protein [Cupriavidus oxalaticus]|uniref:Glycosyltransferase 2-like prokaryotic type domain-containing protein n=1 Tax=Cupriavidus oxalaticus TaxID=96344 RepID=A0A5P3V8R5_9BURK|nr:galactosyltransferase-related protein [Cupriavidus oxalaticus]QEZ42784.1 hypothetical protein D2917_00065 [Cupriavidus oxalaticus]